MLTRIKSTTPLLLCAALLAACSGGGGGNGSNSSSPSVSVQSPTSTALVGSKGDMSNYVGEWESGCGMVVLSDTVKSAINRYTFTSPASSQAQTGISALQGEIKQWQYTDTNCTKPYPEFNFVPVRQEFTLNFYGTVDLAKQTTLSTSFTGTADQLRYDPVTGSSATSSKVAYVAFSADGTKMRFEYRLPFSSIDLVYSKKK